MNILQGETWRLNGTNYSRITEQQKNNISAKRKGKYEATVKKPSGGGPCPII